MTIFKGFWAKLKAPIIGLAPMDGITDNAFRFMTCNYSNPSLVMTEFNNVEGLARGATSMLKHFEYDESQRPIVAQIYGIEADSFYKVALMCCYLNFDGIDLNMGCPANKIAKRGSGAGLIDLPDQAKKIIRMVKKATEDWASGITLKEADLRPKLINALKKMRPKEGVRKKRPISIKTRIGTQEIVTEKWISSLLEEHPACITLHGRTLKQMYSGQASWDEIVKAAKLCKGTGTLLLGNGDIQSFKEAQKKIEMYQMDGVLVGRATCGNPWFFSNHQPTQKERFKVAIQHAKVFEKIQMNHVFFAMRKHLSWYCRGFDGARELRSKLMQTCSAKEVEQILLH